MPTGREFLTSTESNQGSIMVCACNRRTQEAEAGGLKLKQQYQKPQINANKCEGEYQNHSFNFNVSVFVSRLNNPMAQEVGSLSLEPTFIEDKG